MIDAYRLVACGALVKVGGRVHTPAPSALCHSKQTTTTFHTKSAGLADHFSLHQLVLKQTAEQLLGISVQ
ncbi:hypothetical protein HBI56_082920 [Parastagonospora nodorum]|nr:hypothetical protein HBH54_126760 [Parastagonospora nodorum]KAH3951541.1 hypothetical protein HBH53_060780 [Parastagonospora nodorum]KAH4025109.1 hypothetical protein HBI13_077550 [Parastagonospora nodorum]KAH4032460.1 hypothetical protein HBI09_119170 [Parastagonospora nodorum]KAH4067742.1 hypothetical protein HBH50_131180 [Parastagonospora nodorum]